jgi:hypothetical protein
MHVDLHHHHHQLENGGRAVGIPEGIQHLYIAVSEDDMQPKVFERLSLG